MPYPIPNNPSNGGFRPEELSRRRFQQASAGAINQHADLIAEMRTLFADLSGCVSGLQRRVIDLECEQADISRSFWTRLRWLFTGK